MAQNGWRGFVNVDLTESDRATVKKGKMPIAKASAWLVDMAQNGYKVGYAYVADNSTWIVSLTGRGGPNDGLTLTQRHIDFAIAVSALFYVHNNILGEDWSKQPLKGSFDW